MESVYVYIRRKSNRIDDTFAALHKTVTEPTARDVKGDVSLALQAQSEDGAKETVQCYGHDERNWGD